MARKAIDKAHIRNQLTPRREPYWGAPISRGLFLGFRKLDKGGTWVARWHDDDGKHRYHSIGYADAVTHDDAIKAARAWMKAQRAGIDTSKVQTVADACRDYIADRRREKGNANADATEGHYRRYVYGHKIGKVKLAKLRAAQLKDWRAKLDMAPATRNRVLGALKSALNFAVASRYIEATRAVEWRSVKPEATTSKRDLYLTVDQRHALIGALPDYAQTFVRLLSLVPLRPGALAQCTLADFDAKQGTLHIRHDKAHAGRTVPLTPEVVTILRKQTHDKLPKAPLVAYMDGTAWHKDRWKQLIERAAKRIDMPAGTCAYTFRHSVITDMLTSGMDSLTVAKIAGTSMTMIDKTYGHLLQQHAVEAMTKLAL